MGTSKEGSWDQLKGRVKRAAGEMTENEDLKAEGSKDKAKGDVKNVVGEVKDFGRRAAEKVEDAASNVEKRAGKHT